MTAFFLLVISVVAVVTSNDSTTNTMKETDSTKTDEQVVEITNEIILEPVFEKLRALQNSKTGKVRIVHIGDSHIQADLFTGKIRKEFHETFGNGGFGFSFPFSLAKTNGSRSISYQSESSWESLRNVAQTNEKTTSIGVGGIIVGTHDKDFAIEVQIKDTAYGFNSFSIISTNPDNSFLIAQDRIARVTTQKSTSPKQISHTIKKGETLSSIGKKYRISVPEIKKVNHLSSSLLSVGKIISIPSKQKKTTTKSIVTYGYNNIKPMKYEHNFFTYHSDTVINHLFVRPQQNGPAECTINGFVYEKESSGVVYSNIGINGSKCSDFNKTPLFYQQLPLLRPELIIISLGTNESFSAVTSEEFMNQLLAMIQSIRSTNPSVAILVTTPPPSQLRNRTRNSFISEYTDQIVQNAEIYGYAVWNMYEQLGKDSQIEYMASKGILGNDRVHYSKAGYNTQATYFSNSFRNAFNRYAIKMQNKENEQIQLPMIQVNQEKQMVQEIETITKPLEATTDQVQDKNQKSTAIRESFKKIHDNKE